MEKRRKQVKEKNAKKIILILLYITLAISAIVLGYLLIKKNIGKTPSHLIDIYAENNKELDSSEKQKETEQEKEPTRIDKLEELQQVNSDIVAYIEIEGTHISYPVVQTTDNSYYLFKNYKKEYSTDGSIFLDKDVNLSLPSCNFLMYGHNNQNNAMFSELLNYRYKSYYEEHPKIRFVTNESDDEYDILACFYSRAYYQNEKNVFRYYFFVNAGTKADFDSYIKNCRSSSVYDTGISAEYGDQLLTLSTCSYHTTNGRFVVVARKTNNI